MFNLSKGLVPRLRLPNLFTTEFVKLPPTLNVDPKFCCTVLNPASFDNADPTRLDNCKLPDKYLDPATAPNNKFPTVPNPCVGNSADLRFADDNKS